jgi:pyruvyltransferase
MISRLIGGATRSEQHGRTLLSVGSIMHIAPSHSVVWGSGVNGKALSATRDLPRSLDIRSVRGPWSRRVLQAQGLDVPEVFGDPALLLGDVMPELLRVVRAPLRDVLFVPNLNDKAELVPEARAIGLDVIDPQTWFTSVLMQIASSKFVIGSSLHAVIVAEALGIPARFVRSRHEHPFKYRDYLAGSGRELEPIAETIDEALRMGGQPAARFDADALLAAFPWDLWADDESSGRGGEAGTDLELVDGEWFEALDAEPHRAMGRDPAGYVAELRGILDGSVTDRASLERIIVRRRWHFPEVRTESLEPVLAELDQAVTAAFDGSQLVRSVERVRTGLRATAYSKIPARLGTVISLTVSLADTRTAIERVELCHGDCADRIVVPAAVLPTGAAQLDLDVVTPTDWALLDQQGFRIEVRHVGGAVLVASLEWGETVTSPAGGIVQDGRS